MYCEIHGRHGQLSCAECDKEAPAEVLAAREVASSVPSDPEFAAFKAWQASNKKGKKAATDA